MAKYRDIAGMGKSKLCSKLKGEPPKDRHFRRKLFNVQNARILSELCDTLGLKFKITNEGHHWKISKNDKIVEWWPSSAKVVVNKCWGRGIHCHDYKQFIKILKRQFKLTINSPNDFPNACKEFEPKEDEDV